MQSKSGGGIRFLIASIAIFIAMLITGTFLSSNSEFPLVSQPPTTTKPSEPKVQSQKPAQKPKPSSGMNTPGSTQQKPVTRSAPTMVPTTESSRHGLEPSNKPPVNTTPVVPPPGEVQPPASSEPAGAAIVLNLPILSATVSVPPLLPPIKK